jgi:site-specific DNA-methyltransferase (adenine-specific)
VSTDIIIGDARTELKKLKSDSANCVYFDPPFNTNRDYYLTPDNQLGFPDKFDDEDDYISLVEPMIEECKRVLTPDGSFFFHIGAANMFIPHLLCEKHFDRVQPIFWQRSRSKNNTKSKLGACTDVIFWCSTSAKPKFNMIYQPLDDYYAKNSYKNVDTRGNYALGHVAYTKTQAADKAKRPDRYYTVTHNGADYDAAHGWRLSEDDMKHLIADDRIHFPKTNKANLYKKIYMHESLGKPAIDLWNDLHSIAMGTEERVYPTQKPVALLRRIIEMTTDIGDVILDPVAGAGTTGVAATQLGREYIMIDINPEVKAICKRRIKTEGNI